MDGVETVVTLGLVKVLEALEILGTLATLATLVLVDHGIPEPLEPLEAVGIPELCQDQEVLVVVVECPGMVVPQVEAPLPD